MLIQRMIVVVAGVSLVGGLCACSSDAPSPDSAAPRPDQGVVPLPDAAPDAPTPDAPSAAEAGPDAPRGDTSPAGDSRAPDAKRDTVDPKLLEDRSYADFARGTLSGPKVYVSRKRGAIELLDRHDFDGDGTIDLVFANAIDGTSRKLNAYIYFGAKAGFLVAARHELPTDGAWATAAADVDADGFADLLFTAGNGRTGVTNSPIYYGAKSGYVSTNSSDMPSFGAAGIAVADVDRDGYLDVVVANTRESSTKVANSYIYWGSSAGQFYATRRSELPTSNAADTVVVDADGDGFLDVVFANFSSGTSSKANSYVYWGDKTGRFSTSNRAALPTVGAHAVAAADLDKDGAIDLVFANLVDGTNPKLNSYVYWGSKAGFTTTDRELLPTAGAFDVSIADLDADTYLDIVFANHGGTGVTHDNSYIYWGSKAGTFSTTRRDELPTMGAAGAFIADFNDDKRLDIAFANRGIGSKTKTNSYVYWGRAGGFSTAQRTDLPTLGAARSLTADPGSLAARSLSHTFTSRVFDAGSATADYATVSWSATTPAGTSVTMQLRSAASVAAVAKAAWRGPTSTTDRYSTSGSAVSVAHKGQRYIQYRATLTSDLKATPRLSRAAVRLK